MPKASSNSSHPAVLCLTPGQRIRAEALLDELLDLPEALRMAQLHARRSEDAAVVAEVGSLLLAAQASRGFFDPRPPPAAGDTLPDAAIGMRLGAWSITRLIGRGGMGDVYEATRAAGDF